MKRQFALCCLQPTEVTLASGRKYEFAYDDLGDLRSVTTPSMSSLHCVACSRLR